MTAPRSQAAWVIALGEEIRMARHVRGWSQMQLAELLGVSTAAVSRWESGQDCMSAWHYARISRWLDDGPGAGV